MTTRKKTTGFFTTLIEDAGSANQTHARMGNDGLHLIGTHKRDESSTRSIHLGANPGAKRSGALYSNYGGLPLAGGDVNNVATFHQAFTAHSLLARLGLQSFLRRSPLPFNATGTTGGIALLPADVDGLTYVAPLDLALVADGANVSVQTALPFATDSVDWSNPADAPRYAVALDIPHASYRQWKEDGTLDDKLMHSVMAGLGRLQDNVMLMALNVLRPSASVTPADWIDPTSPVMVAAKLAAAALSPDQVGAVIGTLAAGASFAPNAPGTVTYANALPAVLTDLTAGTYVGAFGRAGVIWDSEVSIVASKELDRSLKLTVSASCVPLVPQPSVFWRSRTVSA